MTAPLLVLARVALLEPFDDLCFRLPFGSLSGSLAAAAVPLAVFRSAVTVRMRG